MSSHSKETPKDRIFHTLSSAPGRYFTVKGIMAATGVGEGTIQSVLSRHSELFVKRDTPITSAGGKRPKEYAWLLPEPAVPGAPLAHNAAELCDNFPGGWSPERVRVTPLTVILGGPKSGKTTLINRIATIFSRPEDEIRHAHRVVRVNFASLPGRFDLTAVPFPRMGLADFLLERVNELMVPRLIVHYLFVEDDRERVAETVAMLMGQPALSGVQFTAVQSVLEVPPPDIPEVPACLLVFDSINLLQYLVRPDKKSRVKELMETKPAVEISLNEAASHSHITGKVLLQPSDIGPICRGITAHTAAAPAPSNPLPQGVAEIANAIAASLRTYQDNFGADSQPVLLALDGVDALYHQLRNEKLMRVADFDNALLSLGMILQTLENRLTEQSLQDMNMVLTMGLLSRASHYSRPLLQTAAVEKLQHLTQPQVQRHFVVAYGLAADENAETLAKALIEITSGQPYVTHNAAHLLRRGVVSEENLSIETLRHGDDRPFRTCVSEIAESLWAAHELATMKDRGLVREKADTKQIETEAKAARESFKTSWKRTEKNVREATPDTYHGEYLSLIGCGLTSDRKPTVWHGQVADAMSALAQRKQLS